MTVLKTIHIFNESGEIYDMNTWKIQCHPKSKMINQIQLRDRTEGTNHYATFEVLSDDHKDEFYKYLTLYYEGGMFARYENIEEIPLDDLNTLLEYCNTRQITLFQCPSSIIVGFIHHPQLFGMLSDTTFHPLSTLFKDGNTMGYKTLVTSLPLNSYLDKIKLSERIEIKKVLDTTLLIVVGAGSALVGGLLGVLLGKRN